MREIAVVFEPERKLFLYFAVVFLAIGVGPFGTYEAMTFWQRAVFWSLDVFGGMAIIVPVLHVFWSSKLVSRISSWPRFFLGVALGALPAAAYIAVLYGTVGRDLEIAVPFPVLYVQVTVFSSVLLLTEFLLWPAVFGAPAQASEPETPIHIDPVSDEVPLMSRLPRGMSGASIVSISMQDHYAEVTTTQGTTMILMRLADAVALLGRTPGARIHRSHWVARAFVTGLEKSGRRTEVVLTDGRRLPVGNTYLKAVGQNLGLVD